MSLYNIIKQVSILFIIIIDCIQSIVGVLLPCCSTRGYYQLEFKGSFNKKPIPGPSVNLTVLPDPNKPVSLSVRYDTRAKFPAGDKFPGLHLYLFSFSHILFHCVQPVKCLS